MLTTVFDDHSTQDSILSHSYSYSILTESLHLAMKLISTIDQIVNSLQMELS